MYITDLFETKNTPVVVTYPGRFQPFHQGHAGVFAELQKLFGKSNVYILTSNDQSGPKSPFNFADKRQLMTAAGVPGDHIVQTTAMYALPEGFDPHNTIFVTAVGAPDADRLNPDSVLKRDKKDKEGNIIKPAGSPGYYKIWGGADQAVTADQHGYVVVIPEIHKAVKIKGKIYDVSHGTECRNLWNIIRGDAKARSEFLSQLYGRPDAKLAQIFDKIPAAMSEGDGLATATRADPFPENDFYFPVKDQWSEKLGPMGKRKSKPEVDISESHDPNFVGFMNKTLGNKVDAKPEQPKTGQDWYDNAPTMSMDNMPSYKHAFKFGMSVLQSMDAETKQHFAEADNDELFSYLMKLARKKGFEPKYFVEEDMFEVTGLFSEIFHDPSMQDWEWADLLRSTLKDQGMSESAPPGAKAERMVKHIKKGYARDGKLTDKEKSIAFATAWKAHNAGKVEETDIDPVVDTNTDARGKQDILGLNVGTKVGPGNASVQPIVSVSQDYDPTQITTGVNTNYGLNVGKGDVTAGVTKMTGMPNNQYNIQGSYPALGGRVSAGVSASKDQPNNINLGYTNGGFNIGYNQSQDGKNKNLIAKYTKTFEEWSQKYKKSINCSHPKGFSQKAHCAGKKKHNESIEMEMVCEDCGMCETHGDHSRDTLDEACWKGYHKEGMKTMFGKKYPNCVKNKGVSEAGSSAQQAAIAIAMKAAGKKPKHVGEDAAGVGVVATNKKMARDPRYSTSMTVDVHPDTPKKQLKAFNLIEGQAADKITDAVVDFYKQNIRNVESQPVNDYVKQARRLLNKTDDVRLRNKLEQIFKRGQENPYIQGGIVTTVGALLTGGLLTYMQRLNLSPAQTNMVLQAVLNTVIPTIVSRINGKNWADTIKYTLASAGIGTAIAAVTEEMKPSDFEIRNFEKLDTILTELCKQVIAYQKDDADYWGMVAACVVDPDDNVVPGINYLDDSGKRVHAERAAIDSYREHFGEIPEGSIIVTTLSPCCHPLEERYGESCTELINDTDVHKVYCGYKDPTQEQTMNRTFHIMQTRNESIVELCKSFADTFLGKINEDTDNKHSIDEDEMMVVVKEFLPVAMKDLKIKRLPHIVLQPYVEEHDGQATFGRFVDAEERIYLGIADRHPVDILRTLAHELVHFKQYEDDKMYPGAGKTGSPIENEAHVVAGIIMRHFNKKYPMAIKSKPLEL